MKIYNLFPRLAGQFDQWGPHLERAAAMGFDWVFVNPIQQTGRSGSLYSIADYFAINKDFVRPRTRTTPDDQVRAMVAKAKSHGLSMMIDLVINHCAIDSVLVEQHPEWFVRDGTQVANPFCLEADGTKVTWYDLAQFDYTQSPEREALLDYCIELVDYLVGLGFGAFRCDAAYQIPADAWRRIIETVRARHPDTVFVAETLGCSPEQIRATASAGFDAIFNSSKWWDFDEDWLLDQYELTREIAPSISFPESHDTERLYCESGDNANALRQRYLFAALFSSGVMIPIGFEYGFRARLDVVNTQPDQWEGIQVDLTDYISRINMIKDAHAVFQGEGPIEQLDSSNPAVLLLHKRQPSKTNEALLILNKDPWNQQHIHIDDLYHYFSTSSPIQDVSPQWPMDFLPTPFDFDLAPGMGRILVTVP